MKKIFLSILSLVACAVARVGETLNAAAFGYMANRGLLFTLDRIPDAADFHSRRVTRPDQSEIIRQRLYDYQLYATAGVAQMSFFQQPVGQGVTTALGAVVGSGKTLWDTNMTLGGMLPSGASYMVESIEVDFLPGLSAAANTYTPAAISNFAVAAAATVMGMLNDVNTVLQSGMLELNILQKNYLREINLKSFPPKNYIGFDGSVASNSAAVGEIAIGAARAMGRPYYLDPEISIQPAVNFDVTLKWPAGVATGSGSNGRIGIILDGYFQRSSQ